MRRLFIAVMLVVVLPLVFAATEVAISPEEVSIRENETAIFFLTVRHDSDRTEFFELYSPEIIWDIRPEQNIKVDPGETFRTKLFVRPLKVAPGTYGIPINIRMSGSRELLRSNVAVALLPAVDTLETYLPAFRGNASMKYLVDPRKPVLINVDVSNLNRRNLSNVSVKLRSDNFNKDYWIDLEPRERKSLQFVFDISNFTEPNKGVVKISVIKSELDEDYQYDLSPLQYEIIKVGGITEHIVEEKRWFLRIYNVTLSNYGNAETRDTYVFPSGFINSLFTTEDPKGKRDGRFITWDVKLKPGESTSVQIKRNYRKLGGALFFIALVIVVYYIVRSPLSIKKKVSILNAHEGTIQQLKVRLFVKNRSRDDLSNVEIHDLIPPIAKLLQEYDAGTLTPANVVERGNGTVLKWAIDDLESQEERVITYKISSKYGIVGGLTLPPAIGKAHTKGRKIRRARSFSARVRA